jgi:hypothetical protein
VARPGGAAPGGLGRAAGGGWAMRGRPRRARGGERQAARALGAGAGGTRLEAGPGDARWALGRAVAAAAGRGQARAAAAEPGQRAAHGGPAAAGGRGLGRAVRERARQADAESAERGGAVQAGPARADARSRRAGDGSSGAYSGRLGALTRGSR